jgi:hypothetical protein
MAHCQRGLLVGSSHFDRIFPPAWTVYAYPGATAAEIQREFHALDASPPVSRYAFGVILAGGNDFGQGHAVTRIAEDLHSLASLLRHSYLLPAAPLLVLLPWNGGALLQCHLADELTAHPGWGELGATTCAYLPPAHELRDGLHLNEQGHSTFVWYIRNALGVEE